VKPLKLILEQELLPQELEVSTGGMIKSGLTELYFFIIGWGRDQKRMLL
jgi:hypothetical protein